jgi:hypothetical protein
MGAGSWIYPHSQTFKRSPRPPVVAEPITTDLSAGSAAPPGIQLFPFHAFSASSWLCRFGPVASQFGHPS